MQGNSSYMDITMKRLFLSLILSGISVILLNAKNYIVIPDREAHDSSEIPFVLFGEIQSRIVPGDTVFFRGGTYLVLTDDSMGLREKIYECAFILDKDGRSDARICYFAYPGEKPVFDMTGFRPENKRVSVFYVSGSWLHIKGLEVAGTQVMIRTGNTQSECFSNRGGWNNIYEQLTMHDGAGIGFYLVKGGNNLVLNCDAYNNIDTVSGRGGNVDGFGCHPKLGHKGNVIRGCRAWWNSDDGFDLINSFEPVLIDSCWAFYNGYRPMTFESAADGNGIKAGGYGMKEGKPIPDSIPVHRVTNSLAWENKEGGMYANHHLGGIYWRNNTSAWNRSNYRMVNRKSKSEIVDVDGYGHILVNNLASMARGKNVTDLDLNDVELMNNMFDTDPDQFISTDPSVLTSPRRPDGSLPVTDFLRPKPGSEAAVRGVGYLCAPDTLAQGLRLVWHDEFEKDGSPDTSFWNFERGFVRNHELQWYQPENVYCRDGVLMIEARQEKLPNPDFTEGSRDWHRNRDSIECTSGSINTRGKFDFKYGRLEVRAKIPVASGSWPAIWTLGNKWEWPSCGEIDIMEYYLVDSVPTILANCAWGSDKRYKANWASEKIPLSHFLESDAQWTDKFHVWTMDWTPEKIEIRLDGELLNSVILDSTVNGSAVEEGKNPFHNPNYILLNLAIGGDNGGEPDWNRYPLIYEVDYVRVYQNTGLNK